MSRPLPDSMVPALDEPPAPPKAPETFSVRVYEFDENLAVKTPGYAPRFLTTLQLPWQHRLVMREEHAKVAVRKSHRRECTINHCPDLSLVATIRIPLRK